MAAVGPALYVLCSALLLRIVLPQKRHAARPAWSLKEPTAHGSHPEAAPKYPEAQVQMLALLEAMSVCTCSTCFKFDIASNANFKSACARLKRSNDCYPILRHNIIVFYNMARVSSISEIKLYSAA